MPALSTDSLATPRRPDGLDRSQPEGMSLCQIQEMLDQLEYEEATAAWGRE